MYYSKASVLLIFAFIYWIEIWVNQSPQNVELSMSYFTYAYGHPFCFMPLTGTQAHRLDVHLLMFTHASKAWMVILNVTMLNFQKR